jgi:phospholipase C
MQTRRDFLKHAAILSGAVGVWGGLEGSIRKALAIDPAPGSSFLDAGHVVILMQENRSFDHAYGTLRGVRGYNDPRALMLANGRPVWVQTNAAGQSYAPFRLNIKDTKATWMGSLPHSWPSQVDARNQGKHDHWLRAKRSGHREYADMPLTLGHYTREDIPFYYALADAFTICDQHFCSSITPTLPNRLYHWTGTVRERPSADSPANVRNEQIEQNQWGRWTTFPERLEDHNVSWKVYQNALTVESGLGGEADAWLGNFGDNVLEYFPQYHVKAHKPHRDFILEQERTLPGKIAEVRKRLSDPSLSAQESKRLKTRLDGLVTFQKQVQAERSRWSQNDLDTLPPRERSLHEKAFVTNAGDPAYRELVEMTFQDGGVERRVQVPKGDVFHQFREDVKNGALPTVSWLVAPERLSDHPESAWYGAWFVSEALHILTENPDVWKKTIFILTYDENDGYFDHVPPFVAPHPRRPETGFTSAGVDASLDYVELAEDAKLNLHGPRESPIGLGYRVPLLIASPWTRGGCVCSQVFDHTSVLQFLERFLTHKTGRPIQETNISTWRRTVCGDLTSAFQTAADERQQSPDFLSRDPLVQEIFSAQFKPLPVGFKALSEEDIEEIRRDPQGSLLMSRQEPGVRRSCPLPYELYVDGSLSADRDRFTIRLRADNKRFAERSAGCPFIVYARTGRDLIVRNYAVAAGDQIEDSWGLSDFDDGVYHLQVFGPNGFFREFIGDRTDPILEVGTIYDHANNGDLTIQLANHDQQRACVVEVADRSYKTGTQTRSVAAGERATLPLDTRRNFRWYDIGLTLDGSNSWQRRLAGRLETGEWGFSDPAMGGVVE